jgi:hypothetical protein
MEKPPRSPLLGYNHNVKYGGHIFHVQTEDSGPGNPHLFTHLFFEGSILASKRGQYDPETPEEEVRSMMQVQHKAILKELKQMVFDERISRFFEMRGQTFRPDDFFADDQDAPVPPGEPKTPAIDVRPAQSAASEPVLDLDALPVTSTEQTRVPEPLPIHVTKPVIPGPGMYTLRRPMREQLQAESESPTAQAKPRTATSSRAPTQPIAPVVVQRQVVVGTGPGSVPPIRKTSTTTPVRRRPFSGGPYIVKEGSHASIAATAPSRKIETPPRSVAPAAATPQTPQSPEPKPAPQEGAPTTFVTDQSLDDVILAYLSQGEGKH